jgi:nitronate monooxygenase
MPLIPAVVDAVSPAPVVAAGGIADGRGLAAALALGAAGAWIGTRFLASSEAAIHPRYRERILQANETDAIYLEDVFDVRWPNAPGHIKWTEIEADLSESNTTRQAQLLIILWKQMA